MMTYAMMEQINKLLVIQLEKFGREPLASYDAFCRILGEEYGEICKAVNQHNLPDAHKEALHCVAVIVAFLQGELHDGAQK